MSNHSGTTPFEIFAVLMPSLTGCLLIQVIQAAQLQWMKHALCQFQVEFVIQIFTQILTMTAVPMYTIQISSCLFLASITIMVWQIITNRGKYSAWDTPEPLTFRLVPPNSTHYPFITTARVVVFISTAICILAVDFPIYPRRFAKAETYGFGLMDIGVGAFVLSNAVVAREARSSAHNRQPIGSIKKSVLSSFPVLILGFGRIISTQAVDYHEHVTEYGRHWNFFFTLAVTKICSSVIFTVCSPSWSGMLALTVGIIHQYLLGSGLRNWVVDSGASRDGFLNANREGLASCLGYVSLYLAGVQMGRLFCSKNCFLVSWIEKLPKLVLFVAVSAVLTTFSHNHIEPVSRRLGNISYVLWMVTFYSAFLVMFLVTDMVVVLYQYIWKIVDKPAYPKTSLITEAVNYNTLLCFLLANLMTGFVNLTIETLYTTPVEGMLVIVAYMLILTALMVVLYLKKIQVKCW